MRKVVIVYNQYKWTYFCIKKKVRAHKSSQPRSALDLHLKLPSLAYRWLWHKAYAVMTMKLIFSLPRSTFAQSCWP